MDNFKSQESKDYNCLYIVSTVSLKERTKENFKKDFEIAKLEYPSWQNKTFEQYYEFEKSWNREKYIMNEEDNSYFLDFQKARNSVINNFADINDGGTYNYAIIKKVPMNMAYGMIHIEGLYLFKYNLDSDSYIEIPLNEDDEAKYIASIISPIEMM